MRGTPVQPRARGLTEVVFLQWYELSGFRDDR